MLRTVLRGAVLAAACGLALAGTAQGQLRGGLSAGATYSKMTGDFLESSDYKWNWFAGAYLELLFRPNLSLQVELNYVKKGGNRDDTIGRKCLCNGLMANIGHPQYQKGGYWEKPLVTIGEDIDNIARFVSEDNTSYTAREVIRYLLEEE